MRFLKDDFDPVKFIHCVLSGLDCIAKKSKLTSMPERTPEVQSG